MPLAYLCCYRISTMEFSIFQLYNWAMCRTDMLRTLIHVWSFLNVRFSSIQILEEVMWSARPFFYVLCLIIQMCIQCWMSIYDMWLFVALWIKVYIVIWTWCLQWSLLRGIWAIVYLISYCQGQWLCWVITSKPQNLTSVHISWYVLGFIKGSRTCYIFSLNVV